MNLLVHQLLDPALQDGEGCRSDDQCGQCKNRGADGRDAVVLALENRRSAPLEPARESVQAECEQQQAGGSMQRDLAEDVLRKKYGRIHGISRQRQQANGTNSHDQAARKHSRPRPPYARFKDQRCAGEQESGGDNGRHPALVGIVAVQPAMQRRPIDAEVQVQNVLGEDQRRERG